MRNVNLFLNLKYLGRFIVLFCFLVLIQVQGNAQSMSNYILTSTSGSFVPLSGATSVPSILVDDAASGFLPLGFSFYYMGVSYNQVRAGSDGYLSFGASGSSITNNLATGTAVTRPVIAPFWDDMDGRGTGASASYITTGTPGSRIFAFQWLNWVRTGGITPVLSFQVKLYESTGVIEFIYQSEAGALTGASVSIGLCAIPTGSGNFVSLNNAGASPVASTTSETTTISTKPVTGQTYTFTPPSVTPVDPTTLTFSSVGTSSITPNWIDNSTTETYFIVTRATDAGFTANVVTSVLTSVTTATTGTAIVGTPNTGLTPSTTYFFKIQAANEASVPNAGISGSQATTAPGNFISAASGNWNVGATWVGGIAPSSVDNATIDAAHTVTINASSLAINNLTINNTGILAYGTTPTSFNVNGNLTVNSGGTFNVFFAPTTGKTLIARGNISNAGTIDLSKTGSVLQLTGTSPQTISGAGTFTSNTIPSLTFNNTSITFPSITWGVNNITVSGTLTFTAGRIAISGNWLSCGTAAATGTLTYTAGGIISGTFGRGQAAASTGSAITASTDPTTSTSRYPFINSAGVNRSAWFERATPTGAGILGITYSEVAGTTSVSIPDATPAYTVDTRTNESWTPSVLAGTFAAASFELALVTPGIFGANPSVYPRIVQSAGVVGNNQAGTTTPSGQRAGLTLAQLTSGSFYLGINASDIPFLSVASGDWNDPTKWNKGVAPTCTDNVTILNGHNITVNSATNVSKNVTINFGGTLTVASGDLTVGCTLNNNTITNNGTLTVSGGTLNVNGNVVNASGSTFNQSGGDINVDGNGATSVASGTVLWAQNSGLGTVNGGSLTIVDPPATGTARSFAFSTSTSPSWSGHTLKFGNGVSSDASTNANGFEFDTYTGTGNLLLGNLIVDGGSTTNRWVSTSSASGNGSDVGGNITINANSELRNIAAGAGLLVGGNITNNGTLTTNVAIYLGSLTGTSFVPSNVPQTISGGGIFRNLTTSSTASFANLQVYNSNATGVTLGLPLSISGTFTLDQGIVNTTSTNILSLGTITSSGTLSGGSATAYINGPFARTFAASRTASGIYTTTTLFPVGKGGNYMPIHIDPTTTSGGSVVFTGESFLANSNAGTGSGGVSNVSNNRWEALVTAGSGYLTNTFIRISDGTMLNTNKIVQAPSLIDLYGPVIPTTTAGTGPPVTLTTTTSISSVAYTGYFAYGDLTPCVAPSNQPTSFVASNKTTTSFTGSFTAAAGPPSHYLVVRYPAAAIPTDPVDFTPYIVGGTIGTGTVSAVLTNPTTTFNETLLTANTTYDYYVYSYNNSGCSGPVYYVTSPLMSSVTTCVAVTGTPGTPVSSLITNSSFTATWTASSTPGVNYFLDIATDAGFTTFVPGYNSKDVMMNTSEIVSAGINANTTYYVRVRAELTGCFSVNSGTLTVKTLCNAENAPTALQNFTTFTGSAPAPDCWSEANGALTVNSTLTGTTSSWSLKSNGFANITSSNPGVSINLYGTSNNWFISQPIDLGVTPSLYRISYNMAVTTYNATASVSDLGTHKVNIVVSTDGGATWSNANSVKEYTGVGTYSNTGQIEKINLTGYSGIVKIAFVSTTTSTSPDIDFHIDDFIVEPIPACPDPSTVTIANITNTTATASWSAASPAPAAGYQYYYSTSNTAPDGITTPSGSLGAGILSVNLSGLTANTTYYFWVRSNCTVNQSNWIAASPFMTSNAPYAVYLNPSPKTINDELEIYFEDYDQINDFYTDGQTDIWMYGGVQVGGMTFQYVQGDLNTTSTLVPFVQQSPGLYKATIKLADYFCIPVNTTVEGLNILFRNQFGVGGNNQTNDLFLDLNDAALEINPPTSLISANEMATSADISWTAPVTGANKGYEYAYSTTNTPPGSGTTTTNTSENISGLTPSSTYYFWVRTKGCSSDISNWSVVGTFDTPCLPPTITGTTPGSRCGTGTVTLGATASAGDVYWYAAQTGGAPLGLPGSTFVTPSISTTTTYWAGAVSGGSTENAGRPTPVSTSGFLTSGWGVRFNVVNQDINLVSTTIYPAGTGTVTIALVNSAGTEIAVTAPINVTGTGISTPVVVPLGFNVSVGTGYRIQLKAYTGITDLIRDSSNSFPYASGSGNIVVTDGWSGSGSLSYYWFYNLSVSSGCEGSRTAVVATISSPPSLTLSANSGSACSGSATSSIAVTSTVGDYDTYTWNPATGVNGNENSGYTFNNTENTQYTLTANQTGGQMCQNTATFNLTVNPLPSITSVTATPATVCVGGSSNLLVSTPLPSSYCTASATTGCGSGDEFISNVTFGTINNTTACGGTTYSDFTAQSNSVTAGATGLVLTYDNPGYFSGDQFKVYIDWNQDGVFTTGGNEEYTGTGTTTVTFSIDVPVGALNGSTRMRVRLTYASGMAPCGVSSYGETEDYTINVTGGVSAYTYLWNDPAASTTAATSVTPSATTTYTVTVTSGNGCTNTATVAVNIATTATVTTSSDAGAGSLRDAIACVADGGTVTTTMTSLMTDPININKNVTIVGTGGGTIDFDFGATGLSAGSYGLQVAANKTVTLTNVNIIDKNNPDAITPSLKPVILLETGVLPSGGGTLKVNGATTVSKQ